MSVTFTVELKTFGAAVRFLRGGSGVSAEKAGESIGRSKAWVTDLERGKALPKWPEALTVIETIGAEMTPELVALWLGDVMRQRRMDVVGVRLRGADWLKAVQMSPGVFGLGMEVAA